MRGSDCRRVPFGAAPTLLFAAALTLNGAIYSRASASTGAGQQPARVNSATVFQFFNWLGPKKPTDFREVSELASRVFPKGVLIDGYPDIFKGRVPKQLHSALRLIEPQLVRDNLSVEDLDDVVLFRGDNGYLQVAVILVLRKVDKTVVGVYQGWYGR